MRILFLTQILPYPLDAGPKTRAYYVLRHLAATHNVTLVSFTRDSDSPAAVQHLAELCEDVICVPMRRSRVRDAQFLLKSMITAKPFLIARDWSPSMWSQLLRVIKEQGPFDAIHADQLWMASYALKARESCQNGNKPIAVLDQHNAVYLIPQRLASSERNPIKKAVLAQESRKLSRYEVRVCRELDQVVWVTQEDFRAVQSQASAPVTNSGVIPICVDEDSSSLVRRKRGAYRVTFLGGLHYPPNAEGICWFAENVFGRVLKDVPEAVLTVIGKQPPSALEHAGIPSANLEITGYVDDPKPYLEETAAFIVPIHAGGGMRVKILDAWKWGLPIVSTTVGAEGIGVEDGSDILLADKPVQFAEAVIGLLQDAVYAAEIADAGRRKVVENYNWRSQYRHWNSIYAEER